MSTTWPNIRVFISSTFRDMQEEREVLTKQIFPQLRKLCEGRGVTWSEVDLRWGITEEQKAEGKVLPLCLAEIFRCRPYFIGILGERYGWVPDQIPVDLINQEPWLEEHLDHSVTELEILYGVLKNPEMADHAYFYLRNPAYIDSQPENRRHNYMEVPTQEEINIYGMVGAENWAKVRRKKLHALKKQICASNFPVQENYPDPKKLGELVLKDFTDLINHLYPEDSISSPLDREAIEHEAFAENRRKVYIRRKKYFELIDDHIKGNDSPLVILGESGSGKSALLANWASSYQLMYPDEELIFHFIGASSYSADWKGMLRRIISELILRFDIQLEIPDEADALRSVFTNSLHMVAAKGRVVIIIDAVNQLEDRDQAPDLVWLSPQIPSNIRLIISTLPGRSLDELTKRGWPSMLVEPLKIHERQLLIKDYLEQYTKQLSESHVDLISDSPGSANPLFLRALLEELRLYGDHFTLTERIHHYLAAPTVVNLFERILKRYEQDYENDHPGLVSGTMKLLWAARRGLTEIELRELLGSDGNPLPQMYWSLLYLAAEQHLVSRSGLISFSHDYMRQAIKNLYLPSEEQQQDSHLILADYFENRDINIRKVEELPWQLTQTKSWLRLYALLSNLSFFAAVWNINPFDVRKYWTHIAANSSHRMTEAYKGVLDFPEENKRYVWNIATLLHDSSYIEEALQLREFMVEYHKKINDQLGLARALGNLAAILHDRGDLDKALKLLNQAEQISRKSGFKKTLVNTLCNQALILKDQGKLERALALHEEEEQICHELGNRFGLARSYGNRARILFFRGDLEGAMALHKEQESICHMLGDKDGLASTFGNQGTILMMRGDLDGAMVLFKEQECICNELGNKNGLTNSYGNQGIIFKTRGNLAEAMVMQEKVERICRELGDKIGLAKAIGNQGLIQRNAGNQTRAMELLKEQERICRELGEKDGLQYSLGNQAIIHCDVGELDEGMTLLKEQEHICRELNNVDGLQRSLGNQANIYSKLGNLNGAMELHKEKERICRQLEQPKGLAISLVNQASILIKLGQLQRALSLAEEAYEISSHYRFTALVDQIKQIISVIKLNFSK